MKKIVKVLFSIVAGFGLAVGMMSCASTEIRKADYHSVARTEKDDCPVVVHVDVMEQVSAGVDLLKINQPGFYRLDLSIENQSNKVARIVWAKSAFVIGNQSYVPFLDGEKFVNAGSVVPDTVIPGNTTITKSVFSSSQIGSISGSWSVATLTPFNTYQLVLCVEYDGIENYMTVEMRKN